MTTTTSDLSLGEMLEARAERERAAERERRRLIAELELLEVYDRLRSAAGHDYGCGQRGAELIRRRRVLGGLPAGYVGPHGFELAEAWVRVGAPRLARAERERFRHRTPATLRTLSTWRAVRGMVARREGRGVLILDAERRARAGS